MVSVTIFTDEFLCKNVISGEGDCAPKDEGTHNANRDCIGGQDTMNALIQNLSHSV